MRIASSDIFMESQREAFQKYEMKETFRAWIGNERPDFEALENDSRSLVPPSPSGAGAAAIVILSEATRVQMEKFEELKKAEEEGAKLDVKTALLKMLVEMLSGRKINLTSSEDILSIEPINFETPQPNAPPDQPERAGFGVEYDFHESYHEKENVSFMASGLIRTKDGQAIKFQMGLELNREFYTENNLSLRAGDGIKKDPLVINFGGTAAELTSQKFTFDLDADGTTEQISFTGPQSGFLVLDKNRDGKANDGTELFGPKTGEGFKELSAYDSDHNSWIDENDAVFKDLRIWTKDGAGKDQLSTLAQKNVGAIYLGNLETVFDYKNPDQTLQGSLKSSGIFVSETGVVGSVQQIDLAI